MITLQNKNEMGKMNGNFKIVDFFCNPKEKRDCVTTITLILVMLVWNGTIQFLCGLHFIYMLTNLNNLTSSSVSLSLLSCPPLLSSVFRRCFSCSVSGRTCLFDRVVSLLCPSCCRILTVCSSLAPSTCSFF